VPAFFPRAIAAALAPTASELGLQQVSAAPLMVCEPGDVALDGDATELGEANTVMSDRGSGGRRCC
jgi:hypothetical protein